MTRPIEVLTPLEMKRVYISGKIGDLPFDQVTDKFNKAKVWVTVNGWGEPVSPIDLPHNHDKTWASYMIEDLIALKSCHACYMLSCWEDSPGAKIEHSFAQRMGLTIIYESDELDNCVL